MIQTRERMQDARLEARAMLADEMRFGDRCAQQSGGGQGEGEAQAKGAGHDRSLQEIE
jgi:hypothetical protein